MHMLLTAREQEWPVDIRDKLGLLWFFPICMLQIFEVGNLVRGIITFNVDLLTIRRIQSCRFSTSIETPSVQQNSLLKSILAKASLTSEFL